MDSDAIHRPSFPHVALSQSFFFDGPPHSSFCVSLFLSLFGLRIRGLLSFSPAFPLYPHPVLRRCRARFEFQRSFFEGGASFAPNWTDTPFPPLCCFFSTLLLFWSVGSPAHRDLAGSSTEIGLRFGANPLNFPLWSDCFAVFHLLLAFPLTLLFRGRTMNV